MVVEGREKGVSGRIGYWARLRGSHVAASVGIGSIDATGVCGISSSVVAGESFTSIAKGVAKSKFHRSQRSAQGGRSAILVARKCDSENPRVGSG